MLSYAYDKNKPNKEDADMLFTHDCHGIAFRLVCFDCYEKLMAKGYDGQYYDEADECLDEDY